MATASTQSPPLLPISNPTSTQPTAPASAPTPSRVFISRLLSSLRSSLSRRRPWSELLDRSALSRPDSLPLAFSRIRSNLSYFRTNYALILALALAFSLLSHPFSLLLILALLAAWCSLYVFRTADSPPLVILGRQFSDRETLGGLVLLTVVMVFMTSVGSLLISAAMVGAGVVCVHGAFRVPEDLFLDEQEGVGAAGAGLLSFLGGAAAAGSGAAVRV